MKFNITVAGDLATQGPWELHYSDVIISAIESQIHGVSIVCSTVSSGRSMKTSKLRVTGLCECFESIGDRWIPLTKGQ